MNNITCEDIRNLISSRKFFVYGAGGHGRKFVDAVKRMGYYSHFLGYAESHKSENSTIKQINDIDRNICIFIAAHEINLRVMIQTVKTLGFTEYYSIYPFLIELCCGDPIERDITIYVEPFLKICHSKNYLSIIDLAIESIAGFNTYGEKIYVDMFRATSSESTAKNRFMLLKKRMVEYENGCEEQYSIKVNTNENFILDGAHRLVLAHHFGIPTIMADDYSIKRDIYNSIFHQELFYSQNIINILDTEELRIVRKKRKVLFG